MSDEAPNGSEERPPLLHGASSPPTRRAEVAPLAPESGIPRRCPKCFFLLRGLPLDGACPVCSAAYTAATSQAYSKEVGFFRSLWRWWWPLAIGIVVMFVFVWSEQGSRSLLRSLAGEAAPLLFMALCIAAFVNGCMQSYYFLRRRHLRKPEVVDLRKNAGLVLGSLGCGGLVFATSFFVVAAGSCMLLLSM